MLFNTFFIANQSFRFLEVAEIQEEDLCIPRRENKYIMMGYAYLNYYEARDYCIAYGGNLPNVSESSTWDFFVKVTNILL